MNEQKLLGLFINCVEAQDRMIHKTAAFTNGLSFPDILNFVNSTELPEDLRHRFYKRLKKRLFEAIS